MLKGNKTQGLARSMRSKSLPAYARQRGLSLIELLIGITVGLIILAGVVAVVSKTTFSGLENVRAVQMEQQIRGALGLMQRELQRAGYVNALDPAPPVADPELLDYIDIDLVSHFGQVTLAGTCVAGVCDCILYSYDRNEDGAQGVGSGVAGTHQNNANYELFGFRLNGGAIEMRVDNGSRDACDGDWQDITDPSVVVTTLGFEHGINESATPTAPLTFDGTIDGIHIYVARDDNNDSCTANADPSIGDTCVCAAGDTCLAKRKIDLTIEAELASDSAVNVRMVSQASIKNHYFYDFPAP